MGSRVRGVRLQERTVRGGHGLTTILAAVVTMLGTRHAVAALHGFIRRHCREAVQCIDGKRAYKCSHEDGTDRTHHLQTKRGLKGVVKLRTGSIAFLKIPTLSYFSRLTPPTSTLTHIDEIARLAQAKLSSRRTPQTAQAGRKT